MSRGSRRHTSVEFGRTGLGPAAAIGDRGLGAAPGVIVDGLVETESGVTPGPGIPVRTIALAFGVLVFVAVALAVAFTLAAIPDPLPAGIHEDIWLGVAPDGSSGVDIEYQLMPDVAEGEDTPQWTAGPVAETVIVIDGQVVSAEALLNHLQDGMVRADVTAPEDGLVSRIDISTPPLTGN